MKTTNRATAIIDTIVEYLNGTTIWRAAMTLPSGNDITVYCMTEDGPMEFGLTFNQETNQYTVNRTGKTSESKLAPKHWSDYSRRVASSRNNK
jgi:hypothetical protein